MAIFFEKIVKSVENYKIYGLIRGNLAKTPVPPSGRSKFCTSSPEKESLMLVSYTGI
jgi:hypothetical protein